MEILRGDVDSTAVASAGLGDLLFMFMETSTGDGFSLNAADDATKKLYQKALTESNEIPIISSGYAELGQAVYLAMTHYNPDNECLQLTLHTVQNGHSFCITVSAKDRDIDAEATELACMIAGTLHDKEVSVSMKKYCMRILSFGLTFAMLISNSALAVAADSVPFEREII